MAFARAVTSRISNHAIRRIGIPGPMQTSMRCCAGSGKHYTSVEQIQEQLQSIIDAKPDLYGDITGKGIDYNAFSDLVAEACPTVGEHERHSLFTSMDTSGDGWIQDDELFHDVVLRVLRTRSEADKELHPVQGSYASLPRPPFVQDAKQMMAVLELSKIYDTVVNDWEKNKSKPKKKVMRKRKEPSMVNQLASLFGAKKAPRRRKMMKKGKDEGCKGLYMVGSSGSGKTSILNVFFRSFPEEFPVVRLHWHEFCRDALSYMESASKEKSPGKSTYSVMADEIVKRCQVLLLDEINITTISEGILVKELFRELWQRKVTIVATSNNKIANLYEGGHNRGSLADFFAEFADRCRETDMSSDVDYRTVGVSGSGNFLVGLETSNIEANNEKFETATHGYKEDLELTIPNQKRTIYTRAADLETGVARYTFADLCEKPIGRTEYAVIAKTFHTVFLDEIPKLTSSGADAIKVRRFVSLVDMMYDKKVNLHTLSAVPCQEIFEPTDDISGDDRQGWQRTRSMLTEMESTKYASMAWLMRRHLIMDKATRL